MYISTFNFIFKSTNKPEHSNVQIIVDALQTYNDGKLPVRNHDLSASLKHIAMTFSSAQTEFVTGDPLLQLYKTL